jgi:lipopolysaccharide transport system ATP-binding protein
MSAPIITAANLGKKYSLYHGGQRHQYTALRDVFAEKVRRLSQFRLRRRAPSGSKGSSRREEFWALRDVAFEIRAGEVIGIIGRNGAGKSTLLKILSQITEPTAGRVAMRGRVSSLLEVGTGFHPELTGRENIYLNGAILGMSRAEIRRKFDEIVAFAGVERFLDTPVKRFSSGMYVRLAFGVAAHLESEILVIDEVLAVGDHEFQKKCLGKLNDVSRSGRTVLFVSHNMAAVKSLTTRGIVLSSGRLVFDGSISGAIASYIEATKAKEAGTKHGWGDGTHTTILEARLLNESGEPAQHYIPGDPMCLEVLYRTDGCAGMSLDVFLVDSVGVKIGLASMTHFHGRHLPLERGLYSCRLRLRSVPLASGQYSMDIATAVVNVHWDHYVEAAVQFEVLFSNINKLPWDFKQSYGYGHLTLIADEEIVTRQYSDVEVDAVIST